MAKNDTDLIRLTDVMQAMALLTRLPVTPANHDRGGAAAWAYPLVGLVVGLIAAMTGVLAHWCGLPDIAAALLCIVILILLTGAMHEDGLADSADGLWGGWTRDARLSIMKDSQIGTYGVLALILSLGARWSALWMLFEVGPVPAATALIASCTLSRATMPALMSILPHARDTGLSHSVGTTSSATALVAAGLAVLIALFLTGGGAIWAALWAGLVTWAVALIAKRKISGQTGDILGAVQQLSEIAVLYSLLV